MPTVSGKDLISETTEKVIRRTIVIASIAILTKVYDVPLNDLNVLGMDLPAALFDTVLLILVIYHVYSLLINWSGDLAAFRLWYRESSIWSQFNTNLKLDKGFISGGVDLLMRLYQLEQGQDWPPDFRSMDKEARDKYTDFKTNIELYTLRLDHAGTRFSALTWFGRFYVWVQSFALPIGLCAVALWLLITRGEFVPPT